MPLDDAHCGQVKHINCYTFTVEEFKSLTAKFKVSSMMLGEYNVSGCQPYIFFRLIDVAVLTAHGREYKIRNL
jgi:hypothetical protein